MPTTIKASEVEVVDATELPIGGLPDEPVPVSLKTGVIAPAATDDDTPRPRPRFSCKIMCVDLVEDQMRSRVVAVFAALAFYLCVGGDFIRYSATPQDEGVGRIVFASSLPTFGYLGPQFAERNTTLTVVSSLGTGFGRRKCPTVNETRCEVDSNYSLPVYATARIIGLAYPVEPRLTLRCDTKSVVSRAGTLEGVRRARACTTELGEGATALADPAGSVAFPELSFISGPPGEYEIAFTAGEDAVAPLKPFTRSMVSAIAKTELSSYVGELRPQNGGGAVVATIGVPLSTQPSVKVVDSDGVGLANRTVVVWSSTVPNIYREWQPAIPESFAGVDYADNGRVTHHMRGQQIALLSGETAVTDADGVATFTELTIVASSSKYAYLNFFCEGRLASWNDPSLLPPTSGMLPEPAEFIAATIVQSDVTVIYTLNSTAAGSVGGSLEEATCPEKHLSVVEGEQLGETLRVRLGKCSSWAGRECADGSFEPVVGETAIAVLHTVNGHVLPLMFEIDAESQVKERQRQTLPSKRLVNAISTPSDADGVVSFANISFTTIGREDDWKGNAAQLPQFHVIAFCTAGYTSDNYMSGCALSCPIQVVSAISTIEWSVQPRVIRSGRMPRLEIGMGEAYLPFPEGLGGPLTVLPPTPVVRILDKRGNGLPKKSFVPYVYIPSVTADYCLNTFGVTMEAADYANPFEGKTRECAIGALNNIKLQLVSLEPRPEEEVHFFSDADGFLALPVIWTLLRRDWLEGSGGAEAIAAGEIRLVMANAELTVISGLSQPISFAYAGDAGIPIAPGDPAQQCAQLNFDLHSTMVLGNVHGRPLRPAFLGGMDALGWAMGQNAHIHGSQLYHADTDSWLMPPDRMVYGQTALGRACTPGSQCDWIAQNQNNCPPGVYTGDSCRARSYMQSVMYHDDVDFPGIRLRALDENGQGVPNLRVRLRVLNSAAFPDMPKLTEVVSCGLATREELNSDNEYMREGARLLNARPEMDGVARTEAAVACVTDENGYVEMIVRYAEPLGASVHLSTEYNVKIPGTPEYVRNSPTTSAYIVYDAFKVEFDEWGIPIADSLTTACSTSYRALNIESRAARITWTTGTPSSFSSAPTMFYDVNVPTLVPEMHGSASRSSWMGDEVRIAMPHPFIDYISQDMVDALGDGPLSAEERAAVEAQMHHMRFRVTDFSGMPQANLMPSVKWVGFPQYLVGITTFLTPGCLTTDSYRQRVTEGPRPDRAREITQCSSFMMDHTLEEFGLNAAVLNNFLPFNLRSFSPYASVIVSRTNASGFGFVSAHMHRGRPGLYTMVVQADGSRTLPMHIPVRNRLANMTIVQEPTMQAPTMTLYGITHAYQTPDGAWEWYHATLETVIAAALSGTIVAVRVVGQPLEGYYPLFRAVDANGNSLQHLVRFDTQQGGMSGIGATSGTPATADGNSFLHVTLMDAINGTCFHIEAYFKAFSERDIALLEAENLSGYADQRVSVMSATRFCALNERTLSIVQQPSTAVQLGGKLTTKPIVRVTTPLIHVTMENRSVRAAWEAQAGSGDAASGEATSSYTYEVGASAYRDAVGEPIKMWYVPDGVGMLLSIQMIPQTIGGTLISDLDDRSAMARRTLSANRCIMWEGTVISGRCSHVEHDTSIKTFHASNSWSYGENLANGNVTGGTPINLADYPWAPDVLWNVPLFIAAREGDPPTFIEQYQFDDLRWMSATQSQGSSLNLIATTDATLDGGAAAVTDTIVQENTPASVTFTSIPPLSVVVNEPFLLTGIVRISSGAPLRGRRVTIETAPVSGASQSPLGFIENVIGQQKVDASSKPPELEQESASAVTDEHGVARFVLKFAHGPLSSRTTLIMKTGSVSSSRTPPISVYNEIASTPLPLESETLASDVAALMVSGAVSCGAAVNATNLTYQETGAMGVGTLYSDRVQVYGMSKETFPVNRIADYDRTARSSVFDDLLC